MASDPRIILAPSTVRVRFDLDPALNGVHSLCMLSAVTQISGLGEWVADTHKALSQEERVRNELVIGYFFPLVTPPLGTPDFPSFVDALAQRSPKDLAAQALQTICHQPDKGLPPRETPAVDDATLKADFDLFSQHIHQISGPHNKKIAGIELKRVHRLLNRPKELHSLIVSHLRSMWQKVLEDEWARVKPMLAESVAAYQQLDYRDPTAEEAIRKVVGRDLRDNYKHEFGTTHDLVFIPSAHVGPYVGLYDGGGTMRLLFGARQPEGVPFDSAALSRSDLQVRLSALADDTRLRILKLLTQHHELYAKDIIAHLELSQSSTSRHLIQLAATGYLHERRKERGKAYALNRDRLEATFNALKHYLE